MITINYLKAYPQLERGLSIALAGGLNVWVKQIPVEGENNADTDMMLEIAHLHNALYRLAGTSDMKDADIVVELHKLEGAEMTGHLCNIDELIGSVRDLLGTDSEFDAIRTAVRDSELEILKGSSGEALLKVAVDRLGITVLDVNRLLRVAATIAHLDDAKEIRAEHVAEAIQYITPKYED